MRSGADIVHLIDSWIGAALERPHMYAVTPESLEEMLRTLEHVRHFALSAPPGPHLADLPYHSFLADQGFGVMTFTHRQNPVDPTEKRFADLAEFWQKYLASSYRQPTPNAVG